MASLVIRQFDVFANPGASTRSAVPYVVVLQSHMFEALDTIVVAPPMRLPATDADAGFSKVWIEVEIAGERLTIDVALLANLERRMLNQRIASLAALAAHEDAIRRALDRLFTGF
ncbi:CcdB family protein [Caulobacter flavus]|uniref:CcdB family protein n=1 Tax=Caulobacter flavus TaxID=1679497 RepID=UPI0015DE3709|nr:CcdB family protein [Caulobacter flavus]